MSRIIAACLLFAIVLHVAGARAEIVSIEAARGAYPDLAVDAAGNLHLVYVREGKLWYRQRGPAAGDWSAEQDTGLSQGKVSRSDPEVAIDSRGRPHVLVGSGYARLDGSTWHRLKLDAVRDTALAIDAADNVYIVRRGGHQGGFLGLLKLREGASAFEACADPDIADGLPRGRNDHVYGHLAIHPADNSLHVVYRHGSPARCAYRTSRDGGQTWSGGGVCEDDREGPSVSCGPDSAIYVVSGTGLVFRRQPDRDAWQPLGRAVPAGSRDLPVLVGDSRGRLYVGCFGGQVSIYAEGKWGQPFTLPAPGGRALGFVDLAASPRGTAVYAAWEEGSAVHNDEPAGESSILFARLDDAAADQAPAAADRGADAALSRPVGRWERFEASVSNPKRYADPYRDVTLDVTLTRPDRSVIKFWGFYDGANQWRFRALADQTGQWSYEARFSDGSPGVQGTFLVRDSDVPGLIGRDEANPRWFGYRGGRHLLVRGLHVGDRFFAANWPDGERTRFLDWAEGQGYNTLSIASHFLKRAGPERGADWDLPRLWPPNAAEYSRLERILDELAARRMIVFPFAGFFGQKSNYPTEAADQELYVRYTLARLGCYWNLLWNTAGPEPNVGKIWMQAADVQRLGRLIARLDPFGHLVSVHNRTGDDPYRDSDWTTYGILQGPKTADLSRLSAGLLKNHHPQKPLLAQETLWSGNVNHIRALGGRDYTDDELRKNAWVIHMSAAALVFADNQGGKSSDGFSGNLDPAHALQSRHDIVKQVWDLAQRFPFYRLQPRQDLVDVGFCLAEPERHYLVYLPQRAAVTVKVASGSYRAEWISPRGDGKRHAAGALQAGNALSPPGEGDWLLWLVRDAQ